MSNWIETFVVAAVFLGFFFFFLTRIQRRSKTIIKESIEVSKESIQTSRERIQLDKEMLVVQKETNELLKQVVAKLDTKP